MHSPTAHSESSRWSCGWWRGFIGLSGVVGLGGSEVVGGVGLGECVGGCAGREVGVVGGTR